jgi:hypothetical protein
MVLKPLVNGGNTPHNKTSSIGLKSVISKDDSEIRRSIVKSEGGLINIISNKLKSMFNNSFEENAFIANIILQLISIPTYTDDLLVLQRYLVELNEDSLFKILANLVEEMEKHGIVRQTIQSSTESFTRNEETIIQSNVSLVLKCNRVKDCLKNY